MSTEELRELLDAAMEGDRPHVERMTIAAAVVSEALRRRGMEATLVGGGAIELYAPDIHTTTDLDFVVEGGARTDVDAALKVVGFERRGRHWVRGELFVEVPGNWMSDPVNEIEVGGLTLRVVQREVVLADRIIGFKHWGVTAYGAQAIAMLVAFGDYLDDELLRKRLRVEDAEDALAALRRLSEAEVTVDDERLRSVLGELRAERRGVEEETP